MIIYKTKYYGLLGDRVRQAIKESGRKSSEDRDWIRKVWKEKYGEIPTSQRVANIAYKDYENREQKVFDKYYDDYKKQLNDIYEKYGEDAYTKIDELDTKLEDLVTKGKKSIYEKRRKLDKSLADSNKLSNTEDLEKKWFNSELMKNLKNMQNTVRKGLKIKFKGKEESLKIRKNPNDEKLMKSFETEFKNNGGKEFKYTDKPEESQYDPNTNSIQTSKNPGLAFHELNHMKHWKNNTHVDQPLFEFDTADNVLSLRKYLDQEEGRANKQMFKDIFLNRKSGGRDWRAAHEASRVSNGNYQSLLGVNINKQGMQDLDYNMSPEALKKMRENAKKLGINV
jgi:hypothetical protein